MSTSAYFSNPASLSGDDDDLTLKQRIARVISPLSVSALVPPPPDSAPAHETGTSTPLTGSLARPPQEAVAKNKDTAIGRTAYNTGVSTPPNNGDVTSILPPTQSLQPAQGIRPAQQLQQVQPLRQNAAPLGSAGNPSQPASTGTTANGIKTVIKDLNGTPAGSPLSTMQPAAGSMSPLQPVSGLANNVSPVRPAQPGTVMPANTGRFGVQPIVPQPVQPGNMGLQPAVKPAAYQAGVPLATQQGQRLQAYSSGPGPAMYAGSQSPVSTDPLNPDPNASLRPGGSAAATPAIPQGAPQQVQAPSQLDQAQAKLANYVHSGSGIDQIQNNGLRRAARVGDAALSAILPGIAPLIGGTTAHNQQLIGREQGIVGNLQGQQTAAAQQADTQSQADERRAKMAQDIANAGKADRYDPNAVHTVNTAEGVFGFNPDTGAFDRRIGGSPEKLQEGERPLGSQVPNLNKTLQDRYQVLHPGQPLPAQYRLPATATQKDYERIDKALGGVEGAEGTHTQQQQTLALRQQALAATEAARAAGGSAALDRETARMAKPYEKANETASSQLDKIDDAANMIGGNAEAQALGIPKVLTALVGGQGTGVRITTPELQAIATARGWAGDFQGTLNSISGKGKLTSTQQQQLKQILRDVKDRITQKRQIANDALDKINGGATREDVIAADKEARQRLTDLESGKTAGAKPVTAGGFDWSAHPKVNP